MAKKKSEVGTEDLDLSLLSGAKSITEFASGSLFDDDIAAVQEIDGLDSLMEDDERKPEKDIDELEDEPNTEEDEDEGDEEDGEEEEEEPKKYVKKRKTPVAKEEDLEEEEGSDDDGKASALRIFAEFLDEKGIVDFKPEEFEDTDEYIVKLVNEKINAGIDKYKEELHPKIKELIENYEDGVPIASFLEAEADLEDYLSISDAEIKEDVNLQKALIRERLAIQGYNKQQIDKKVKRFEEGGLLEDEAVDARGELISMRKAEQERQRQLVIRQRQEAEKNQREWLTNLRKDINDRDEIIPGLKINQKQKDKLYDGITKLDKQNKNELLRRIEKDKDFNLKVAYVDLILNWDFSALETKGATKNTRKLKEALSGEDSPFGKGHRGGGNALNKGTGGTVDFNVVKKALRNI